MFVDVLLLQGFNMKKVTRGSVVIKLWDIGGQPRFRSMWERYCRGVNCIVFVVDAADRQQFDAARAELHELCAKPALQAIPLLVLANKNDLPNAANAQEVIAALKLQDIEGREVSTTTTTTHYDEKTNNLPLFVVLRFVVIPFLPNATRTLTSRSIGSLSMLDVKIMEAITTTTTIAIIDDG